MEKDVIIKEWLKDQRKPKNFAELGRMVHDLVDFYEKHSIAKKEDIENFVNRFSVFDFVNMFSNSIEQNVVKKYNVKKTSKIKTKSVVDVNNSSELLSYPLVKKFSATVDGRRNVWKISWPDNVIYFKNPPEKKFDWKLINITKDFNKYKCSKIGDVLYAAKIGDEDAYYYMFNCPNDLDRLSLRHMYHRMFEYGKYNLGDVKLTKIDEVNYEKSKEVEYK